MTAPDERAFITFNRGQIRDDALAVIRNGLRNLVNPETGVAFTEDEIRIATQPGSRLYIRFDAIDLMGQAFQQRARWTAQQGDPRLAVTSWLRDVWGPLWLPDGFLPASSSHGNVAWSAPIGSTFIGSTTLGDPASFTARDAAGNLYQASVTVGPTIASTTPIPMIAVSGGPANPRVGAVMTGQTNVPTSADPTGTVTVADFVGGFGAESDAEFVSRLVDVIRFRPASGNAAQFRAWTRAADVGVENAWVYSTALNSNTVVIGFTAKRGGALGPLARIADATLLGRVRSYITPPGSAVTPGRPFVLAHTVVSDPVDLAMTLTMRKGTTGGWFDVVPWPTPTLIGGNAVTGIVRVIGPITGGGTDFFVTSTTDLPNGATSLSGVNAPSLMIWNSARSNFEQLSVQSVTKVAPGAFEIVLNSLPSFTFNIGDAISPYSPLALGSGPTVLGVIPQAAQAYFDSLGPGEVVDLVNDPRGAWAYRWPEPSSESPSEAGQLIVTTLSDFLGEAFGGAQVIFISHTTPQLPIDLGTQGPSLITLNAFGVYSP